MGWNSAGDIFDPVARAMVELGAPDAMKIRVLSDLIGALQDGDWDTEQESLDQFADDAAIREAFRQHDVFLTCNEEGDNGEWCDLERDHEGDHADGEKRWPRKGATPATRYCLVTDDDCHHYVIEAEHRDEWYELDDDQINAGLPWAWQVGGEPGQVTFTAPEIFGQPVGGDR